MKTKKDLISLIYDHCGQMDLYLILITLFRNRVETGEYYLYDSYNMSHIVYQQKASLKAKINLTDLIFQFTLNKTSDFLLKQNDRRQFENLSYNMSHKL